MKPYIVCAGVVLGACAISTTAGQPPTVVNNADDVVPIQPREPGGTLRTRTGIYLTIEGVKAERGKFESDALLVDTVDGKKLDKPIPLVIRGAYIAEHNLRPAIVDLPAKQRCTLRGYESGSMIGVPPAIRVAAKEQGWKNLPESPKGWSWRPYFVTLVVVEPKGLELRKTDNTGRPLGRCWYW